MRRRIQAAFIAGVTAGLLLGLLIANALDNPHNHPARTATEKSATRRVAASPSVMLNVPAGEFWIGCNANDGSGCPGNQQKFEKITLPAFKIDKTEVTVAQYANCVLAGICSRPATDAGCSWAAPGKENHPINCVSWDDAYTYCKWAGARLPTEQEWEKAARGTDGRQYPWGDEPPSCERANIIGCGGEDKPVCPAPNGNSPYDACDMAGNVWEWTDGWYEEGKLRPLRGGSWNNSSAVAKSFFRAGYRPTFSSFVYGFRCASD